MKRTEGSMELKQKRRHKLETLVRINTILVEQTRSQLTKLCPEPGQLSPLRIHLFLLCFKLVIPSLQAALILADGRSGDRLPTVILRTELHVVRRTIASGKLLYFKRNL
jgi:hypothetical protein